jgi:hypothetical protein
MGRAVGGRALGRGGLAFVVLTLACAAAWAAGWGIVAAVSGLAAFAIASAVAGVDSRRAGDWTSVPPR